MSSAFGIANAIGPSLGGFLTQYCGWRSVFYVNLPVGLLSLFFVWRYLRICGTWSTKARCGSTGRARC